jgi:hypothetical protein
MAAGDTAPMRAMRVLQLIIHGRTHEPVAVLGETEGARCVPVFLRRPQADAIALGRRGAKDRRGAAERRAGRGRA